MVKKLKIIRIIAIMLVVISCVASSFCVLSYEGQYVLVQRKYYLLCSGRFAEKKFANYYGAMLFERGCAGVIFEMENNYTCSLNVYEGKAHAEKISNQIVKNNIESFVYELVLPTVTIKVDKGNDIVEAIKLLHMSVDRLISLCIGVIDEEIIMIELDTIITNLTSLNELISKNSSHEAVNTRKALSEVTMLLNTLGKTRNFDSTLRLVTISSLQTLIQFRANLIDNI